MRELTLREARLPAGGASQEFRTVARNDIPRWEEPPGHWVLMAENPPATGPGCPAEPVPLHWLPPGDEWPQLF